MANPADPSQWTIIPDYGHESQYFFCSTCGMPHRTGEPVFRGNYIEYEGYYDQCVDCAITAGLLAGLVDPATFVPPSEEAAAEIAMLTAENESLHELIDHLRSVFES